ncbi:DUF6167 family protein [Streptomyces flavofungini]|uniref:DUF6167 family protein n=1 Tax=Streptomyces flavofungini TaxID=68200 RepID=UPI0025AF950A|nr:DUF6167 family protein [Streptomyces flavofungini]WJV50028.1 DUF6167 family protein [Streptomyces flavofungini]
MFRRTFWFTAGAAAGVWATTKVNRKLKQLTPESLAARAADKALEAGHRIKDFALDVRDGMAEREAELGEALGVNAPLDPELPAQRRFALVEPATKKTPKSLAKSTDTTYSYNRNEDH